MKKMLFLFIAIILAGMLIFSGCAEEEATPVPSTTSPAPVASTTSPAPVPSTTSPAPVASTTTSPTPAAGQPVYGGVMKVVSGSIPTNLGYVPEKSPGDNYLMLPVIERLCQWDENGNVVPWLAESWDVDENAPSITWHLVKGVKFHDGTDFNAEALQWNYQLVLDASRLTDGKYIESMDVVDTYTLRMNLSSFNWVMLESYGLFVYPISPTAFNNAGGGDIEKSKAWARANAVGTGPFTVSDYKRDDHITFTKNPNYWQEGMPYLDGITLRYIPDPMVAAASIEAREADIWFSAGTVQNIIDLQRIGMKLVWGPGYFNGLLFNSSDPASIFTDKKVREAVEYALDRPAIANMLGQGLYEPLQQMASKNWPGYVEGYNPRPYNPEKAKQLLSEAGFPNGFETTILGMSGGTTQDAIAAIQSYLGKVGIIVTSDIADTGRYVTSAFRSGWKDIVLAGSGINPSATDIYTHFGPSPLTFRSGTMYKSPEYLALCVESQDPKYKTAADAMPKIREAVKQAGEDAMLVPLYRTVEASIMQLYVHTDYPKIHGIIWHAESDWMEKH